MNRFQSRNWSFASDAVEDSRLSRADAAVFETIGRMLRDARHAPGVAVQQRHIIVLEKTSARKASRRRSNLEIMEIFYLGRVGCRGCTCAACGGDSRANNADTSRRKCHRAGAQSPGSDAQLDTLRPTLTVKNATSDQTGTRIYEFQISDNNNFTRRIDVGYSGLASTVSKNGVPEGTSGKTSFTVESDLQPTTIFYWRVRAVQGSSTGPWSATERSSPSSLGSSAPASCTTRSIHGETVGQLVGSTTFIPGKGLQLNNGQSYVKYLLPQTITTASSRWMSKAFAATRPGDKAKVMGMQEGQDDFITNRYRVDIQYRGTTGSPPNAITFRALYGSGEDLSVRFEPSTATRFASVFLLNPTTTYHWKTTWGPEFRVVVREGGITGNTIYNVGMGTKGTYAPNPQYQRTSGRRSDEVAPNRPRLPARSIATCGLETVHGRLRLEAL